MRYTRTLQARRHAELRFERKVCRAKTGGCGISMALDGIKDSELHDWPACVAMPPWSRFALTSSFVPFSKDLLVVVASTNNYFQLNKKRYDDLTSGMLYYRP